MLQLILTWLLSSMYSAFSKEPYSMDLLFGLAQSLSKHIVMQIGPVHRMIAALQVGYVSFLGPTQSLGLPKSSLRWPAHPLKLNIGA